MLRMVSHGVPARQCFSCVNLLVSRRPGNRSSPPKFEQRGAPLIKRVAIVTLAISAALIATFALVDARHYQSTQPLTESSPAATPAGATADNVRHLSANGGLPDPQMLRASRDAAEAAAATANQLAQSQPNNSRIGMTP